MCGRAPHLGQHRHRHLAPCDPCLAHLRSLTRLFAAVKDGEAWLNESSSRLRDFLLLSQLRKWFLHSYLMPVNRLAAQASPALLKSRKALLLHDDCPPSPSIAHQPAASVAPCASQPVTNLAMLAHFGDLLLAFKKQRQWSSAQESVCSSSACDELRGRVQLVWQVLP